MAEVWSDQENHLIIDDYFVMLSKELKSEPYSKTEHRRALLPKLNDRSEGSIEFKHQNISAVLMYELGFPAIAGYKPAINFQNALKVAIQSRLAVNVSIEQSIEQDLQQEITLPTVADPLTILVDKPDALSKRVAESKATYELAKVRKINYLQREAAKQSLGLNGELFALDFERARLVKEGKHHLADKLEHTSLEQGDGAGFDIHSYEANGTDRFIEVKTTKYGKYTPFYLSSNELQVSRRIAKQYHLYRLFEFRSAPRMYMMQGDLTGQLTIEPVQYIARI